MASGRILNERCLEEGFKQAGVLQVHVKSPKTSFIVIVRPENMLVPCDECPNSPLQVHSNRNHRTRSAEQEGVESWNDARDSISMSPWNLPRDSRKRNSHFG